ncbi:MAG: hypothetical protein HY581_07475 [Nitrospirae bacterium]|nr:hypothetical protein [Nitrospirota bacterium]
MRKEAIGMGLRSGVVIVVALIGLSGCDYWPPALQAQIEQLRTDAQTAVTEKAKVEAKLNETIKLLNETTKLKDELQARVDEFARLHREQAAKLASLEKDLAAERQKMAKSGKKAAPAKASAKASPKKKPAKAPAKKGA